MAEEEVVGSGSRWGSRRWRKEPASESERAWSSKDIAGRSYIVKEGEKGEKRTEITWTFGHPLARQALLHSFPWCAGWRGAGGCWFSIPAGLPRSGDPAGAWDRVGVVFSCTTRMRRWSGQRRRMKRGRWRWRRRRRRWWLRRRGSLRFLDQYSYLRRCWTRPDIAFPNSPSRSLLFSLARNSHTFLSFVHPHRLPSHSPLSPSNSRRA